MNRNVSNSDDAGTVAVGQARRETQSAERQVIALTADEQREFWLAVEEPAALTVAQEALGALMRDA